MSMDVCDILLGRPWQCDRDVVYFRKKNYYKVYKDGIKHKLVPIKDEETAGTSETRSLFLKQVERPKEKVTDIKPTTEKATEEEVPVSSPAEEVPAAAKTVDEIPTTVEKSAEESTVTPHASEPGAESGPVESVQVKKPKEEFAPAAKEAEPAKEEIVAQPPAEAAAVEEKAEESSDKEEAPAAIETAAEEKADEALVKEEAPAEIPEEKTTTVEESVEAATAEEKAEVEVADRKSAISFSDFHAAVQKMVEAEIEKHVADGIGRVDYAVASGGGRCLPLKGSDVLVSIKLRIPIFPQAVTLEHVSKCMLLNQNPRQGLRNMGSCQHSKMHMDGFVLTFSKSIYYQLHRPHTKIHALIVSLFHHHGEPPPRPYYSQAEQVDSAHCSLDRNGLEEDETEWEDRVDGRGRAERSHTIWRFLLQAFSKCGDIVVDHIAGSGSFIKIASESGHHAFGLDPHDHIMQTICYY